MISLVIYCWQSACAFLQFLLFATSDHSAGFAQAGGSKLYEFLCLITEPLIQPFRSLTDRIERIPGMSV